MQKGLVKKAPFSVVSNNTTEKKNEEGISSYSFSLPEVLGTVSSQHLLDKQEGVCSLWNLFSGKCSKIHGPKGARK